MSSSPSFPNAGHSQTESPPAPPYLPTAPEPANPPVDQGETRHWYYPPATLRYERELLQKYGVNDFSGLLTQAHLMLAGLAKVMKGFSYDIRVRGYVISGLGTVLEQAAGLVSQMQHIYGKVKHIEE